VDATDLTAVEAAAAIRAGKLTAEELVRACLARIAEREPAVEAWAWIDAERAIAAARRADHARRTGVGLGPLHGVPVGVKDIIDTAELPTENGTVLHAGRQPVEDAAVVVRLREAGGIVLGKTVTTELAVYAPGKTKNPHDPGRTPGGSSSGSAAAVAAGMAPLAIGTQTNGSVIRPSAYCGVVGYKPSYGSISRAGILRQSPPLDQVGVMARTVEDAALLVEALAGFDARDPATRPGARPRLLDTARAEPPAPPRLAFVRTPSWERAEAETREGFARLVAGLGDRVDEVELPSIFAEAVGWHRTIMEADLARSFAREYATGRERLSGILREMLERGRTVLAMDYTHAVEHVARLNAALADVFATHDAIVTPASTGTAPRGLGSTGSPIFCTLWTLCGTPAITLPILRGGDGMPLGVQLVAARGDDARLLRTARWLMESTPGT
jgi:Asp-tRNA(Asn)/Glu-tRNA(Gln) amidotransferase A subunit family amidase